MECPEDSVTADWRVNFFELSAIGCCSGGEQEKKAGPSRGFGLRVVRGRDALWGTLNTWPMLGLSLLANVNDSSMVRVHCVVNMTKMLVSGMARFVDVKELSSTGLYTPISYILQQPLGFTTGDSRC
jgi:hypothetical protein